MRLRGSGHKTFSAQWEPARDSDKAGVGLSLSIARTIVREHGGDVTLSNCDGAGLRVRFELPAKQVEK